MLDIILGYIWHWLVIVWPYFAPIASLALSYIAVFHLGRWVEHRKWRREIKNGNRLGELTREQLKKRDTRIRQLTRDIAKSEDRLEQVGIKHRALVGLSQEIINVAISEDSETLRRRKRA